MKADVQRFEQLKKQLNDLDAKRVELLKELEKLEQVKRPIARQFWKLYEEIKNQ